MSTAIEKSELLHLMGKATAAVKGAEAGDRAEEALVLQTIKQIATSKVMLLLEQAIE